MRNFVLFVIVMTVSLALVGLPSLADEKGSPLPHPVSEKLPQTLLQTSSLITFTPVATSYLPIVMYNYPPAPEISNISYELIMLDYEDCLDGGDYYEITFDYTDPDGDAFATYVDTTAVFFPSGETYDAVINAYVYSPSDGYSGLAGFEACLGFTEPDIQADITVTYLDWAGFKSNPLTITISKPSGVNPVVLQQISVFSKKK
jgi:hypothetical protein